MAEDRDQLDGSPDESLDDEVEGHARYAGNTNESAEEDDEVEAHMRRLDPNS